MAAAYPIRGVVEAYYGEPWSHDERLRVLRFLPKVRLNTFVYGPKDDPYHRVRWRDPYPDPSWLAKTVALCSQLGLWFVYALHPIGLAPGDEAGVAALLAKLDHVQGAGVRNFALFFDDLHVVSDGGRHHDVEGCGFAVPE